MGGKSNGDGTRVIDTIHRAASNPNIRVRKMPWILMQVLMRFVPLFWERLEMRYLWNMPIRMANKRLKAVLGAEPHMPLEVPLET
jgi:hypothetical protein